jgi:hypothetical protein
MLDDAQRDREKQRDEARMYRIKDSSMRHYLTSAVFDTVGDAERWLRMFRRNGVIVHYDAER